MKMLRCCSTAAVLGTYHELFTSKFNDWTRGANGVKLNSKPLGRCGSYIADALDRTRVERTVGVTRGPETEATVCTAPRRHRSA